MIYCVIQEAVVEYNFVLLWNVQTSQSEYSEVRSKVLQPVCPNKTYS
jgi:hypothetical protein